MTLKRRRAQPFFARHPWVFQGAIASVTGDPEPGDEVALQSNAGEFIARGLFNPHSQIVVRLYEWAGQGGLNDKFWSRRIAQAIQRRAWHTPENFAMSACRLINSEGDGLSGLMVDRYGDYLLVQFTSLALAIRQESLLDELQRQLDPKGIWLRTEKGIGTSEQLELKDGLVRGEPPPRPMTISENGIQFQVDVAEGHKTGFYLDQRDNRLAVTRYTAGKRVLDMFCYSGGMSLNAVINGNAESALGVDTSQKAIDLATANAELNSVSNKVEFRQGKAFPTLEALAERGQTFDVVILDPPKMTRHRKGLKQAMRGYHSLNLLAANLLNTNGILVTCSCSGLVGESEFRSMLADVARSSGRSITILESRGAAADHPVSPHCPEGDYLKCMIASIN